ncbi:MAG: NADH-quinone oxidoreductase subunit C [Candidatus Melainabacteria bacterium]|nr:NADH-quinone oxidoreductase subunit C [Candidatus Melainabacteria bacterium]
MKHGMIKEIGTLIEQIENLLKENTFIYKLISPNHVEFTIDKSFLPIASELIIKDPNLNASLLTITATDKRELNENYVVNVVFSLKKINHIITLKSNVGKFNPSYPAISKKISYANWYEREIHDLFGIVPDGIELDPLVLHRDWHPGKCFPVRKDFPKDKQLPITDHNIEFIFPHGEGLHQIAVGPIHAGIIEPGHFRFCALGEEIHKFDVQLFYAHKGIEKMAEGKTIGEVLTIAENICGMCSYSHSTAFCIAIESLGNISTPPRATFIRTICLELERLASHMSDLMAICSAGGFGFASAHAARLRETIMRQIYKLTGHRFFRSLNTIGGLQKNISDKYFDQLFLQLVLFKADFNALAKLILNTDSLLDRLELTGFLSKENALSLGLVGPAARGSSIDIDVRHDTPYLAYKRYKPNVPLYDTCDALARTKVRIDEVNESLRLIKNLIEDLPPGDILAKTKPYSHYNPGIGIVESPKGELVHWIMLDKEDKIFRYHVRSASYINWRGVAQATMGKNIVPDGPLVNKSFNLCYACVDR